MVDKNHSAKTRPLNFTKEQILKMEKMLSSSQLTDMQRHHIIKDITEKSPCCICRVGIPSVVEFYCDSCLKTVYEREKLEADRDIPEMYGCVQGDWR